MKLGRPRIAWKVATSLDGAIAAKDGSSKWITSELSRVDVKTERTNSDAILTGTGTVLADDPSMLGAERHPVRIVMGEREISDDKKVFSSDAETIRIQSRDLDRFLEVIKDRGFNRVFLESGPTLGTALFKAGLIDELLLYQAPTIIGSSERFTKGFDLDRIEQQIRFLSEETQEIGGDIKRLLFLDNAMNREFSCSPA
jgi:diaminohydroxyphosphoribosylaminopyrimidine deaminase/5-amino-6-(5-phosphoribosylamino)uracil reductase